MENESGNTVISFLYQGGRVTDKYRIITWHTQEGIIRTSDASGKRWHHDRQHLPLWQRLVVYAGKLPALRTREYFLVDLRKIRIPEVQLPASVEHC